MSEDHNQRLGFEKFSKRDGTEHDAHRHRRLTKKTDLREVTVKQACQQLLATDHIDKIIGVFGGGKEATVLVAQESDTGDYVCAKVFRYFTSTIRKRLQGTKHILASDMASIAAKQEYWNLKEMWEAGIAIPKPRLLIDNIVVMDLVNNGQPSIPAPLLREVNLRQKYDVEEILLEALDILADIFLKSHHCHGDYSEHNLMLTEPSSRTTESGLITMDVSQSVQYNRKTFVDTPERIRLDRAINLLETDIYNLNNHFQKKYRLHLNPSEVIEHIVKELPTKLQDFYYNSLDSVPFSSELIEGRYAKQVFRDKAVQERTGMQIQRRKW